MTTTKPRYKRLSEVIRLDIDFDDAQEVALRTIKDEDGFVSEIAKIAALFRNECEVRAQSLTLPETRATL